MCAFTKPVLQRRIWGTSRRFVPPSLLTQNLRLVRHTFVFVRLEQTRCRTALQSFELFEL